MGSGDILEISLTGGAPWGFRLMGGEGFPLEVAKVRKKSKAQTHGLTEGDIILSINGNSMQGKSHEDAMYLVDNAQDTLSLQIQRPRKKSGQTGQVQQTTAATPAAQGNVVSSASTTYSVNEGDKRRSVTQHEFEEALQGGIMSKTFVKHEEIVNKQPQKQTVQTNVQATTSQQSEPMQIYVKVDDQAGYKENISPIPSTFKPNSASSPVPMFSVKNIKETIQAPALSNMTSQQMSQQNAPAPFTEHSSNIPMFKVSKFEAHKFQDRPPRVEQNVPAFDPATHAPVPNVPMAPPPPPPLPPTSARDLKNAVENEPMLFPVPKYTSEMLRQDALERVRLEGDSEEEEDDEHHGHLPIFAPPVQFTLEDRNLMDSGYEENLLTPRSVERPHDLPDLDIHSIASGDHDAPDTPETGSTGVRRKKKLFSDSAFYDDPDAHYPTIEEQMDLCKKIARSLTSAANRKARGARMFAKRKRKSGKWVHDGECHDYYSAGDVADLRDLESELSLTEGGTKPLFSFRIPNLAKRINYHFEDSQKMSLSPDEFERLRLGKDKVDHRSVSPNTCHNLVMDLQSPKNRGAKLFQKRAARSEKWVIDETNAAKPPPPRLQNMVSSPAKPMLSPWEAAMENPIGSVDRAFEHLDHADRLREVNQTFKQQQQQQQWRPPPQPHHPVTTPYQQTVTHKKTVSLKSTDQPNVITGPNYNRLAKGWQSSQASDSYSRHQYPHAQQQFQTFRQEPPPPPPPQKPLKQVDNYDRSVSSYSASPHGHTRSTTTTSHHTAPYGGGYGQPRGYTTTDSYNYQMTAVSDF